MTRPEVSHFMEKIKAYYQNFSMEDYVVNEWYDKLKKFELEDVYKKLDEHLNGEYKSILPQLHYITKYLKTKEEKKSSIGEFEVRCQLCNKIINFNNYDKHYSRCSSIRYIQDKSKQYFLQQLNEEKLYQMTEEDFNIAYIRFLETIKSKTQDTKEYKSIQNVIDSKNGKKIKFDENIYKLFEN